MLNTNPDPFAFPGQSNQIKSYPADAAIGFLPAFPPQGIPENTVMGTPVSKEQEEPKNVPEDSVHPPAA